MTTQSKVAPVDKSDSALDFKAYIVVGGYTYIQNYIYNFNVMPITSDVGAELRML